VLMVFSSESIPSSFCTALRHCEFSDFAKMVFGKICAPNVAKAVHRLRAEGKTLKSVASYFGFGEEWARRILLNYHAESGEPKLTPGTPGRPRKTTVQQDEKMLELVKGEGLRPSSGQIAVAMKVEGMDVSSSTIRRRLRDSKVRPFNSIPESWNCRTTSLFDNFFMNWKRTVI
jgi:transposase